MSNGGEDLPDEIPEEAWEGVEGIFWGKPVGRFTVNGETFILKGKTIYLQYIPIKAEENETTEETKKEICP